jgi:hypothetical protein
MLPAMCLNLHIVDDDCPLPLASPTPASLTLGRDLYPARVPRLDTQVWCRASSVGVTLSLLIILTDNNNIVNTNYSSYNIIRVKESNITLFALKDSNTMPIISYVTVASHTNPSNCEASYR